VWSFRVSPEDEQATGDTSIPVGFVLDLKKKSNFGPLRK